MPQVWLITGSSRGLGRALADAVLSAGHSLVATARRPDQLADLAERYGSRVHLAALDVVNAAAARAAVQAAVRMFGHLDVLVNNAGYGDVQSIEDTSDSDFREQIEVNLFGVVNVTRAVLPVMREQGWGHIINVSSIGGRRGTPGLAAYQTAKWGVEGFSEVLAKEVRPLGIKVTIVEPGGFRTDWAGESMTIRPSRPEYAPTVGTVAHFQRAYSGTQPGDPAKAAAVMLHVASLDEPPLRLLLGTDAVQIAEQEERLRSESDRKWRELSVSTDFGDANAGEGLRSYPWDKEASAHRDPQGAKQ
jgi:NAD(P)-dependent dehydrogenase (short-subunit alcohol dehydrogenase family)